MHLDIKPDPEEFRLTPEDIARLASDAAKPLTGLEKEQVVDNTRRDSAGMTLRAVAEKVVAARVRFMREALQAEVAKGELPAWIFLKDHAEDAQALLKERGYHFHEHPGSPMSGELRRGATTIAVMHVDLVRPQ